ncbi:hypothetical protein A3Q56_04227 [Intoshia linei]|uniref:inositol-phosphate phosphatase n=1 Tax=Intoshia linei TaxID=1819745 RepID=A0A177B3P7_9BILA|nr:hypothetical protein A3Q56_04227 [Intoshia linei]
MSLDCKRIMASLDPVLSKLEHIFMEGYNTMNKTIDHKSSDVDLVTIYDKRIEDTFKQEINKLYPNHLIIGEESFENRIVLTDTPTWIIDPIDGTTNFIHRFPQCCISIALSHNKLIILAIIFNVVENKKFTAIKDCGAFLNDRKISCSKTTHLKKCLFLTERGGSLTDQSTKYIMDMSKECRGIRMLGSAALNLAYVAAAMGRGKPLTDFEKSQIMALKTENKSHKYIAKQIKRSRNVVSRFIHNPESYGKSKSPGRPKKLTSRTKSHIIREALSGQYTARDIMQNLELDVKLRTVQQKIEFFFTRKYVDLGTNWNSVIFSDEKKLNLDGPDGFQFYWHDLRKKIEVYSTRQNGGGSKSKSKLAILNGNQNSEDYIFTLSEFLLPLWYKLHFQQDNAPIHTSGKVKTCFEEHSVNVMNWPSKSPDLNPIENLWGILARSVYKNGRQFKNRDQLTQIILTEWENIHKDVIEKMGLHIWDMAAGYLILKESGAIVCDPTGKPFDLMSRRVLAVCSEQLKKEITSRTEMYSTINYYERED